MGTEREGVLPICPIVEAHNLPRRLDKGIKTAAKRGNFTAVLDSLIHLKE